MDEMQSEPGESRVIILRGTEEQIEARRRAARVLYDDLHARQDEVAGDAKLALDVAAETAALRKRIREMTLAEAEQLAAAYGRRYTNPSPPPTPTPAEQDYLAGRLGNLYMPPGRLVGRPASIARPRRSTTGAPRSSSRRTRPKAHGPPGRRSSSDDDPSEPPPPLARLRRWLGRLLGGRT